MRSPIIPSLFALLLTGCGAQTVETGLFDNTIVHKGVEREYLLYIPPSYDGETKVPLLISIHGALADKEWQSNQSGFNELADRDNFILLTPESTVPPTLNTNVWNIDSPPERNNDVSYINLLINTLEDRYNIDMERVYAAGSSNGAYMAFRLACDLGDRIAAIAAIKGVMNETQFNNCNPTNPVAVLQMHGNADTLLSYAKAQPTLDYWIELNQANPEPVVTDIPDPNDPSAPPSAHFVYGDGIAGKRVEHFRIEGGDHDWFAPPEYYISATEEAWKFVQQFTLSGAPVE